MKTLRGVLIGALIAAAAVGSFAAQRVMVIYNAEGRGFPQRELSLYDVEARRFQGQEIEGFVAALDGAQLLYIGQYGGHKAQLAIFDVPERAEAVREFLARGGTLVFDYNGLGSGSTAKFLNELGLEEPAKAEEGYYDVAVASDAEHAILSEPHDISGDLGSAYGGWTEWGEGFDCLIEAKDDPPRAALLVADDVAGEGTIIATQLFGIFRDEEKAPKNLFENILSYAFGSLPGPGEAIAVYDP